MTESDHPKRIVLTTYGSLGDLHPYIALALELKSRGHRPVIATSPVYREKVEPLGLEFHPTRPDFPSPFDQPELAKELTRRAMDARTGGEFVAREMFAKPVRESYVDLMRAVEGADLLVTHPIAFAGPLVAQMTGIRWISTILSPIIFFSAYDTLIPPHLAGMAKLFSLLPVPLNRLMRIVARATIKPWFEQVEALRKELGLPYRGIPIFEAQHSPSMVLAMFSMVLAEPRADWPPNTHVTGFCFYDKREASDESSMQPELKAFLESGTPPIVFTLGSSAVWDADRFYQESIEAALCLGERAVLLIGHEGNRPENLPDGIVAFEYAPYGEIMPRAKLIVHQGGVGTTAQALYAGKPALFVPFSHDQPDNAWRVQKLGIARMLTRRQYKSARVAKELSALLSDPRVNSRAEDVGAIVRSENGPRRASELIEKVLAKDSASEEKREELSYASGD
ncbi:MAG TPA: nucleotide disphospho-sugar-binding domain-containing protein [Pyrinomonadaceae bacterium]|jgi:UDP:flavonoid glycosyltransferase YjiC (YdhE family)